MSNILKVNKISPDLIDVMNGARYKEIYIDWLYNNETEYLHNNLFKLSIIKNINTPIDILFKLYDEANYTNEELTNSIINKLVILTDLEYLENLIYKYENIMFIHLAISQNININDNITKLLMKLTNKKIIANLIKNNKLSLEEIIDINSKSSYGLKDLAYNHLENYINNITSPIKLEKLMNYTSMDLNFFISKSSYLTYELFNLLSLSSDFRTRAVLAKRVDTPIEILHSFINDESDTVRLSLVKNETINSDILSLLAFDNKLTVIREVITHKNTTIEILSLIIDNKNITDNIKNLAKQQFERLKNLYSISNHEYYKKIESIRLGIVDEIKIISNINLNKNRKKIIINLNQDE